MAATESDINGRSQDLNILVKVARSLNGQADLKGVLQDALRSAAHLLGLETGWIWLLDEETDSSYLAAERHLPPALGQHPERMETQGCWCLDAYRKGAMHEVTHTRVVECSRLARVDSTGTDGLAFHTSVPLFSGSRRLGLMNLASRHRAELTTAEQELLRAIGDLLSVAVDRSRLYEASVQAGAMEERLRLSREIHDSLGQGMTAVLLRLEALEAGLGRSDTETTRRLVAQTIDLSRQNLREARRAVLDLRALSVETQGLVGALAALADQANEQAEEGQVVSWRLTGGNRPVAQHVEAGLYRIAQEAIRNAQRHAQAKAIDLELRLTPDTVQLRVADDGCGFDPQDLQPERHGLVGMTERARLLGADLTVQSQPGEGTQITASLTHTEVTS